MLKSLVRVSRRVDWIAEQLVTDLSYHSEAHSDTAHPPQSDNTVRQSSPVERREGTEGPCLEKRVGPYLDPTPTADAVVGYNSPAEAGGTFQRSFDRHRIGRDAAWKEVRRSVTVYPREPVRETASDGPLLRRRRPHG